MISLVEPTPLSMETLTDEKLWHLLRQGDRLAFAQLYERYYAILYSYGYKLFPQMTLVEDAVQDLFIDLWRMRENLSAADSIKFYLFRSLRRSIHRLAEKENAFLLLPRESVQESTEQSWIDREQETLVTQRILTLLKGLPSRQLEVITLRYYENFRTDEIALIMGISEKAVRNTLYKALTQLRQHLPILTTLMSLLSGLFGIFWIW